MQRNPKPSTLSSCRRSHCQTHSAGPSGLLLPPHTCDCRTKPCGAAPREPKALSVRPAHQDSQRSRKCHGSATVCSVNVRDFDTATARGPVRVLGPVGTSVPPFNISGGAIKLDKNARLLVVASTATAKNA